jgi:hypothetical protein
MLEKMAWSSSRWLCTVVVGLSLMVGGCTTAEKSEEPMFLSVTLAQEELKGKVKKVTIISNSYFGDKIRKTERFFLLKVCEKRRYRPILMDWLQQQFMMKKSA